MEAQIFGLITFSSPIYEKYAALHLYCPSHSGEFGRCETITRLAGNKNHKAEAILVPKSDVKVKDIQLSSDGCSQCATKHTDIFSSNYSMITQHRYRH